MQELAYVDPIEELDTDAPEQEEKASNMPLLARYLRDIGKTDLLSREDEQRLSQELEQAREGLVELYLGLSADTRAFVITDDKLARKPQREWRFSELDRCYERLLANAEVTTRDATMRRTLREAKKLKARLDSARESMIRANLKLVTHVAKEYSKNGFPDMDLIQEGNLGLLRAVEKFEPERGFRFSTYAYWWVRQAVGRAVADRTRLIRIPVHLGHAMKKVQRALLDLGDRLGREPTQEEIARSVKLPVGKVDEILRLAHGF